MNQKLSEQQAIKLTASIQTIMGAVNVAQLEYYELLPDYQAKLSQIKQRSRRLLEDLESIKKLCYTIVNPREQVEHIDYEMGYELHRLFSFFSTMEYNQLKDFNNLIYQHPTIDIHELSQSI